MFVVTSFDAKALVSSYESNAVDVATFSEKERLKMCKNALKERVLADKRMKLLPNERPELNKFYSLIARQQDNRQTESRVVQAFKCPTRPPIFLQVHYWDFQGYVAWVIVKKEEQNESLEGRDSLTQESYESRPRKTRNDTANVVRPDANNAPDRFKIKYVEAIEEGTNIEVFFFTFLKKK